jgi:hypothetical protein
MKEGEIRDEMYARINSAAVFSMLGNAILRFAIRGYGHTVK